MGVELRQRLSHLDVSLTDCRFGLEFEQMANTFVCMNCFFLGELQHAKNPPHGVHLYVHACTVVFDSDWRPRSSVPGFDSRSWGLSRCGLGLSTLPLPKVAPLQRPPPQPDRAALLHCCPIAIRHLRTTVHSGAPRLGTHRRLS